VIYHHDFIAGAQGIERASQLKSMIASVQQGADFGFGHAECPFCWMQAEDPRPAQKAKAHREGAPLSRFGTVTRS
jgi:hypothetical protein